MGTALRIGLIGLPASGKSTVFNALTGARVATGFSGKRDQPNVAVVKVPDERIDTLVPMFNPRKTVYATVEFADIGGLKGSGDGGSGGFSTALIAAARQVDALAIVLGAHEPNAGPSSDLEEVELELNLADLSVIEKRLERLTADLKKSPTAQRAQIEAEQSLLSRLRETLEQGTPLRAVELSGDEEKLLRGYGFLTAKPVFVILNVSEQQLHDQSTLPDLGLPTVAVSGEIESEIAQLEPADARAFLDDLGIEKPGIDRVIQLAYRSSRLISFFTVGPDEVRAWTIADGSTALEAAGTIHTDIARGLIRAEVIAFEDLIRAGGLTEAKKLGLLRLEGKTYRVKDAEICHFLSNI